MGVFSGKAKYLVLGCCCSVDKRTKEAVSVSVDVPRRKMMGRRDQEGTHDGVTLLRTD